MSVLGSALHRPSIRGGIEGEGRGGGPYEQGILYAMVDSPDVKHLN